MPVGTVPAFEPALSIPEVAQALRIHHTHVRRLIKTGEIRARKVGNVWRITPAALREFMGDDAA
jgi:excisionase family DNA binding protein